MSISDQIKYKRTLEVAHITAVNSDGSFDVKIGNRSEAYAGVTALDGSTYAVGDSVLMAATSGNRNVVQILMPSAYK